MRHLRPVLLALCATACSCVHGQNQAARASLSGTVVDPQGGGIANATVSLKTSRGTITQTTASDASGHFVFTKLASGPYNVVINAKGFQELTTSTVAASEPDKALTFTLQVATVQTSVVVTATRSERSIADVPASVSVVTGEQIEQTPARTIDDLLRRVPSSICR